MAAIVEQMTWLDRQNRWVKKITSRTVPPEFRKQYFVSPRQLQERYPDLVTEHTRAGSRTAANQFWCDLQARIRTVAVPQPTLEMLCGKKHLSKRELGLFNDLLAERLAPARKLLSMVQIHLPATPPQAEAMTALANAALAQDLPLASVETEAKFSYWREKWLALKRAEVKPGSYVSLPHHLTRFEEHVGSDRDVATINEQILESFKIALAGLVQAGEISPTYAKNICTATVKPFIRYLAKHRKMILPLNLDDLSFSPPTVEPQAIPLETCRLLLKEAAGRLKCWLLLMFNCCYYQSDLNELKPDEIDWEAARITRKRTKEANEAKVPTVTYPLWPETFAALKEWGSRSGLRVFTLDGKPLIRGRADHVAAEFGKLRTVLGINVRLKQIRKTSVQILNERKEYGAYVRYYGGWSPLGVADRSYLVAPQPVMDEMSEYLRGRLL